MEKQKTLEVLQSVQNNSPADSKLRRKLMDQFVIDAAYGCFMRTANPFFDWRPLRYPHNLTRSLPEGITRKDPRLFLRGFSIFLLYWRMMRRLKMQILSQEDHAFCEHPKDLQQNNSNDQGPSAHSLPSPWSGLPLPEFTSLIPEGITRQELGIIKLTAQFDAVYGLYFREEIEKMLIEDPRFAFLIKPTDNSKYYSFFSKLSLGYDMVLIPSRKKGEALIPNRKMSGSPSLETVLEGFWNLFEMVEEGVDMGIVDLHAFEFFANTEDQELNLPHQYLLMIMYPLVPPFAHLQARIPRCHYPQPPPREHPNTKRLKVDKDSSRPGKETEG